VSDVEQEEFSVGLRVGGGELIGFSITAKSTQTKRTMFFGLLALVIMVQVAVQAVPLIERFVE